MAAIAWNSVGTHQLPAVPIPQTDRRENLKNLKIITSAMLGLALVLPMGAQAGDPVGITPDLMSVTVNHNGAATEIIRNQDNANTVNPAFGKTSRKCPPFCIQPAVLAPGVETIAEREMIHYAKMMSDGDSSIVVVDSRTPNWVAKGTIPSAINVPWTKLNPAKGATPIEIAEIMQEVFNVKESEGLFDFTDAKTAGEIGRASCRERV